MASTANPAATASRARPKAASTPFGGALPIATIGLIATLIGFLPTFFLRLNQVDAAHLVHGWTMIGWLVLVATQASLIRSRAYQWHRRLGWASLGLFVLMVGSSCQMVVLMLSGKSRLPFELAKFFAYSDIVDMPLLLFLFASAIARRKDRHLHSRLVSATVLTSIVPALARMFNILIWRSMDGLYHAMHPTYLLILTVLAASILLDYRKDRLRWPLPLVFGWFVCVYATQWAMMDVPAYNALAHALGQLG